MKIGIIGTGIVGCTIGSKLIELEHSVMMGSRTPDNVKALEWAIKNRLNASSGTFEDAAFYGEMIFICTNGSATLEAVKLGGKDNFQNKVVIDLTNPLDFTKGMPPSLIPELSNTNSLGEEVQKFLNTAFVVKTLNTVNCEIMINPGKLQEDTTIFLSGNDTNAKARVTDILTSFGWKEIIDLGDITTARGTEMMIPFWVNLMSSLKSSQFNFKIVK